ncbi:MAG: type II secretion system F family protein [Planctomycetaceae bacterium]|jgi:tight adherence protein C
MWVPVLFAAAMSSGLTGLLYMFVRRKSERSDKRVATLSEGAKVVDERELVENLTRIIHQTLPKMGQTLIPDDDQERSKLKTRLLHAGLYSPNAMPVFLGVKFLLMAAPLLFGIVFAAFGAFSMTHALLVGSVTGLFGLVGPSFWLDRRKAHRQLLLRRALPDACDLIVICLSGGLSLIAALVRVVEELQTAHPLLAAEMRIVEREVQLGHKLADSLLKFGNRSDLPELQNLAAVVMTAEKYGSSMTRTLEKFSESLRLKRQQYAEAMAQKAATKILFPTLLFIFPAILLVILGPAMIQVMQVLGNLNN